MNKKLFVRAIKSIEKQIKYDVSVAETLAKIFPNSYSINLIYDNSIVQNILIEILKDSVGDNNNWIEYFCWELDFGKENYRLKVTDENNKEIPMSNASELWNFFEKNKKKMKENDGK